jgi:light-regulated signal transduction histidine kinase (bacteriophytochrome)
VLAVLCLLLAGVVTWWALRQWVLTPLADVARATREVVAGRVDHAVPPAGPREVAELAADVEAMRERLVAEYEAMREQQQLVEQQAEELRRSNTDLEQFAYVASHDLQEPLRKVASFCQLLERRYKGQLDERGDQYIAFAVDGAKRMQLLINDLLAFSRVGRTTGAFSDVDCDAALDRALSNLEEALAESEAEMIRDPLPTVRGDFGLLTQLFANLVGNAVKFRAPQRRPVVHVSARQDGDVWEFCCADNGIGIEPQYAERVFVIFQRLHQKDEYSGTGIGLALCKKIVEFHGGRIWIDTDAADSRQGTTIRWTIPARTEEVSNDS